MAVISLVWKTIKYFFVVLFLICISYAVIFFVNYEKNHASAWSTTPPLCEWNGDTFPDGNWRQAVQDAFDEPDGSPYGSLTGNVKPAEVWTDADYVIGRTTGFDDDGLEAIQIHFKSSAVDPADVYRQLYFSTYNGENVIKALMPSMGGNGNGVVMVVNDDDQTVTTAGTTFSSTGAVLDSEGNRVHSYDTGTPNWTCIYEANVSGFTDGYQDEGIPLYDPNKPWSNTHEDCSVLDFGCWFGDFLGGLTGSLADLFEAWTNFFYELLVPNANLMSEIWTELETAIDEQLGLLLFPADFIHDIYLEVVACGNYNVTCDYANGWHISFFGVEQDINPFTPFGGSSGATAFYTLLQNVVRLGVAILIVSGYQHLFTRIFRHS